MNVVLVPVLEADKKLDVQRARTVVLYAVSDCVGCGEPGCGFSGGVRANGSCGDSDSRVSADGRG